MLAPRIGLEAVRRPRVNVLVDAIWTYPLTLISAPDGYGKTTALRMTVPSVNNTSFTIDASVTLGAAPAEGAIVAQGGSFGGWSLGMNGGVPTFTCNWLGLEVATIEGDSPVGAGDHSILVQLDYDGVGKGGNLTRSCDGNQIAEGRLEKTVPQLFSFDDGLDVGDDNGEKAVEHYGNSEGAFTDTIHTVTINVAPDASRDPELAIRSKFMKQ